MEGTTEQQHNHRGYEIYKIVRRVTVRGRQVKKVAYECKYGSGPDQMIFSKRLKDAKDSLDRMIFRGKIQDRS